MRKSLGLLEIKGLASAIVVADAMAKTAAVELLGIETAKGGGWMTIKVLGDVAAVQASLSTGQALAERTHSLVAQVTLARPDQQVLDRFAIAGVPEATISEATVSETTASEAAVSKAGVSMAVTDKTVASEPAVSEPPVSEKTEPPAKAEKTEPTCNLCHDPLCPRIKGEAHSKCLYHKKVK
ncbi:BMC domain-containing protein [Vibrio mangrovi]|uniref:BMC domain-containing protein n=1 Tax=Vibrio mangrovi TaxID=474394 RepID=A0A1Y6J032_9VIBR|nr:BMC domain-containing protein [Vibrio mangrovi]MDW6005179.1 BMC domain-containing protein [Vibrio mangrovi]SMS02611.1 Major carboxysome shell protein 1C [Vibrio mangrovi]